MTASRFLNKVLSCVSCAMSEGMSYAPKRLEVLSSVEDIKLSSVTILVDGQTYRLSVEKVASMPERAESAEEAFNNLLSQAKNHNELTLLSNAGWEEGFPSEDSWSFYHEKFPGVTILWVHGSDKGRARKI